LRAGTRALLATLALFPAAGSGTFSIDATMVASGSTTRAASPCFHLSATIGEPVAGVASSATFYLVAGSGANVPADGDDLFFNSFEDCAP